MYLWAINNTSLCLAVHFFLICKILIDTEFSNRSEISSSGMG